MTTLRETQFEKLSTQEYDVLIIGAGINGAVSAASLAGRGATVAIIDKGDFAGCTSQESSNLVWGGIKYLENYEFSLVFNLCRSRNTLLEAFPSTIREIRFLMAIRQAFKYPLWMVYVGTWLYWVMGRFFTQKPRVLSVDALKAEEPCIDTEGCKGAVEYSDAYLLDNDARFVFNFIRSAMNWGAVAVNYAAAGKSEKTADDLWLTTITDQKTGQTTAVKSRLVINAAGPYVDEVNAANGMKTGWRHVFSKGVHLIVNRIPKKNRVLTFFDEKERMFFLIPMGVRSVIGTTDTPVNHPQSSVTVEDRRFLLDNINSKLLLKQPLCETDIIAERCGVRPLVVETDDEDENQQWLQLSRKHVVFADEAQRYLSIYGGKLTDCLNIGNEIADWVQRMGVEMPDVDAKWFGEPSADIRKEFFRQAELIGLDNHRKLRQNELLSVRLWRRYGTIAFEMLEEIRRNPGMAEVLIEGTEYLRCELYVAARTEMIVDMEDFLRRRSKIGLVVDSKALKQAKGMREASAILFGNQAQEKTNTYFSEAT